MPFDATRGLFIRRWYKLAFSNHTIDVASNIIPDAISDCNISKITRSIFCPCVLEFPFDYSISNDSSRHIGFFFFSIVRRLKAIFHGNRKYIFLLQFLMKSDPYRADRFYLIIITVYVKTPESNMRYIS